MKNKPIIVNDSLRTENFSRDYVHVNKFLLENGETEESRNGVTKEILDFKTTITNPYKRCVGNNERNINVFFLLAEAMWIWTGKKDVATLKIFNDQMGAYSDDGEVFHAPYGFRLRHSGVSSTDKFITTSPENTGHNTHQLLNGDDQIREALQMLLTDPQSRRVVLSIWNPTLDLNKNSKDLPCNDLLMLKIRKGKLISTIANRSNDLHWGLPTNVFQFSYIGEMIGLILGIELGTQTHNSQSLHIYTDNDIALRMYENMQFSEDFVDLYDVADFQKIDYNFAGQSTSDKLFELDNIQNLILESLREKRRLPSETLDAVRSCSNYFALIHDLLHLYIDFKFHSDKSDASRVAIIRKIQQLSTGGNLDILVLAQSFYYSRIKDVSAFPELKTLMFSENKF